MTTGELSTRSVVFFQSRKRIYLLTDTDEVISLDPVNNRIHRMKTFNNSIRIEDDWIKLQRIKDLVSYGNPKNSKDTERKTVKDIIQEDNNVIMKLQGEEFKTFIRIHG